MSYEIRGTQRFGPNDNRQAKPKALEVTDIRDAFASLGPNQMEQFKQAVNRDGSIDQDDLKLAAFLTSDKDARQVFLDMAEDSNFRILNADGKSGITSADVKPLMDRIDAGILGGVVEGKLASALKKAGTR